MPPPKKTVAQMRAQIVSPRKSPGSRTVRHAAKVNPYFAVCLVMPEGLVARHMGDNRGSMPVFLIATSERRDANVVKATNLQQAYVHYRIAEKAVVDSKEHMDRLKSAVDEMLLGNQTAQDNVAAHNKFRDVLGSFDETDPESVRSWWLVLLEEGQRLLRERGSIRHCRIYDDAEYDRRIVASARRGW
jgi:hypothetical protein